MSNTDLLKKSEVNSDPTLMDQYLETKPQFSSTNEALVFFTLQLDALSKAHGFSSVDEMLKVTDEDENWNRFGATALALQRKIDFFRRQSQ